MNTKTIIIIIVIICVIIPIVLFLLSSTAIFSMNKDNYTLSFAEKYSPTTEPTNLAKDPTFCNMVTAIKKYYGNTDKNIVDPSSDYYTDTNDVISKATDNINNFINSDDYKQMKQDNITPLIMSDMDDTIWSSYGENIAAGFCYNPEYFDKFSSQKLFAPIFPALQLLKHCAINGIVPVFVTGRAANQSQADITSIQLQGFALKAGSDFWGGEIGWANKNGTDVIGPDGSGIKSIRGIFMHDGKDTRTGAGSTATQYKTDTRTYIEQNGLPGIGNVKFIASIGDQWSDSNGGHSGIQIKIPNPMYFIP